MGRAWWRTTSLSRVMPRVIAGFLVGATAVAACTPSAPRDAAQVVADPAMQQILQHIPADTPYAFVSMGSKSARDFLTRLYAPLQKYVPQLEDKLAAFEKLGVADDKIALVRAVYDEFKGRLSADGFAELGFDVGGRFAIYGLGVLPAMRIQLSDPAALRAMLERVQAKSGTRFPTGKLGDVEYWHIAGDKIEGAVAIIGDQLVAGAAPVAHKDRVFALLLGAELPARHLGNSEGFQHLLTEYGLARVSAGFVDARLVAEAFLGEGDALNKDILGALAPEVAARWPGLGDGCKQEIRSLVALAPRLVFGTEQMDGDGFTGKFILELRRDLAQELMAMRTSVPGLDAEAMQDAVLAMGAGLDVDRAMNFVQSKAVALQAAPYGCPALVGVNETAAEIVTQIKQADPAVRKSRGFAIALDEIKLAGMVPTSLRGFASVAFTDTKALLTLLGNVTQRQFSDDGSIASLPDNTIPFLTNVFYGLKTGLGGAIAFGAESEARTKALLAFTEQPDPPLMVMVYDMTRFAELMGGFIQNASDETEMMMVIDFYKAFGSIRYTAHAGERGVVMSTRMSLR
jgi:hypothetical protein